jgi:hypothetical protein
MPLETRLADARPRYSLRDVGPLSLVEAPLGLAIPFAMWVDVGGTVANRYV